MPATKTEKEKNIWEELRKPFPTEVIGKVNKGFGQIDFVGHAAVTDRLNSVDPTWTWEPMARDEHGAPYINEKGGLWILLTVGGVTRPGYGDDDGKTNPNSIKVAIGDAIKNAAMRFGVALELWTKDELESQHTDKPEIKPTIDPPAPEEPAVQVEKSPGQELMDSISALKEAFTEKGITDTASKVAFVKQVLGKPAPATPAEYKEVMSALESGIL